MLKAILVLATIVTGCCAHGFLSMAYFPGDRVTDFGLVSAILCGVFAALTYKEITRDPAHRSGLEYCEDQEAVRRRR